MGFSFLLNRDTTSRSVHSRMSVRLYITSLSTSHTQLRDVSWRRPSSSLHSHAHNTHKRKKNWTPGCLSSQWHLPDTDDVIGVAGVQGLTVSGPRQRNTLWHEAWLWWSDLGLELVDNDLVLQILQIYDTINYYNTRNMHKIHGIIQVIVRIWRFEFL